MDGFILKMRCSLTFNDQQENPQLTDIIYFRGARLKARLLLQAVTAGGQFLIVVQFSLHGAI